MDKFQAMSVFVRVVEAGSFSRAAEALDLANASVTTCIRNLERSLGVTLLHRDTRRLRPTEEGEAYLVHARKILDSVQEAESDVQSRLGRLRGRLVVESPISFAHALLCPALPLFAARYPDISTSVTLTNQPHHLIERAIDVAIRMDKVEDAELVAKPIYEARYLICCTPEIAIPMPDSPTELDMRQCLGVLPEERPTPNPWVFTNGSDGKERLVLRPQGPVHFNSNEALVGAALAGVGVIRVLDIFVNYLIRQGRLVALFPDWQTPTRTFYAATTRSRLNSVKVRVFNEFLAEIVDEKNRPDSHREVKVKSIGTS